MKWNFQWPLSYGQVANPILQLKDVERGIDCGNCSMAARGIYGAELKCCTFSPFIPNYLLGEILVMGPPVARESIKSKLAQRAFALPVGLCPTPDYQLRFKFKAGDSFGNDRRLLCDFYDQGEGGCRIWRQRPSPCRTFVCESSFGERGREYWRSLATELYEVELSWSQECMLEGGFSWPEVERNIEWIKLLEIEADHEGMVQLEREEWKSLWCHHLPAPEDFYIKCFQWAKSQQSWPVDGAKSVHSYGRMIGQESMISDMQQRQQQIVEQFAGLDSWEDRYKKLIDLGKDLPELPAEKKIDDHLVKGCQSQVWMYATVDNDGRLLVQADSDALIVKGIISLLLQLYSQASLDDVIHTAPIFVNELGFDSHLSPSRANGLGAMVKQIKFYALAYKSLNQ